MNTNYEHLYLYRNEMVNIVKHKDC